MVGDILKGAEKITLKNMQRSSYFRIAADVIVYSEILANTLVETGIAVKYEGGKKTHKWCDPINE
jgi:micrococcal nuclease